MRDKVENVKPHQWGKGISGNPNGRPKGKKNKNTQLKKLINDLAKIIPSMRGNSKQLAYDLYDIALSDLINESYRPIVEHLYFIESSDCIKIGKSMNVQNRFKTIQKYAEKARIIKVIKNAGAYEKRLHNLLQEHNYKDNPDWGIEWFHCNEEVMDVVSRIHTIRDLHKMFGRIELGQVEILF